MLPYSVKQNMKKPKKHEKSKAKVIYGSAMAESEVASIAADVSLVAFGVNKLCSEDSMKIFLK